MNTAITIESVLELFGIITALVAGISAVVAIVKWITTSHDKNQKFEGYDTRIKKVDEKIDLVHSETESKLQQIQAEQCMLTYCMLAVLDGLKQQGCNGPVTEAKDKLEKFINKQAHEVT